MKITGRKKHIGELPSFAGAYFFFSLYCLSQHVLDVSYIDVQLLSVKKKKKNDATVKCNNLTVTPRHAF